MNKSDTPVSGMPSEFGVSLALASVLVVDDEPGMRNFLVKILAPRCKRVEQAANVVDASKLLDEKHFDIVILDNIMPNTNGLDWLKVFRGCNPDYRLRRSRHRNRGFACRSCRFCPETVSVKPDPERHCAVSGQAGTQARKLPAEIRAFG